MNADIVPVSRERLVVAVIAVALVAFILFSDRVGSISVQQQEQRRREYNGVTPQTPEEGGNIMESSVPRKGGNQHTVVIAVVDSHGKSKEVQAVAPAPSTGAPKESEENVLLPLAPTKEPSFRPRGRKEESRVGTPQLDDANATADAAPGEGGGGAVHAAEEKAIELVSKRNSLERDRNWTSVVVGEYVCMATPFGLDGTRIGDLPAPPVHLDGRCDASSLVAVMSYSNEKARWIPNENASKWCPTREAKKERNKRGEEGGSSAVKSETTIGEFPGFDKIDREYLISKFLGRTVLFLGDSMMRNAFVLASARICNPKNWNKCSAHMITPQFGDPEQHHRKGPLGCIPKGDPDYPDLNTSNTAPVTPCFTESTFEMRPIKGLTMNNWPSGRKERKKMLTKGWVMPSMRMTMRIKKDTKQPESSTTKKESDSAGKSTADGAKAEEAEDRSNVVTFVYLGITTPTQLNIMADYMRHHGADGDLWPDAIFASVGPHLRMPYYVLTPFTIPVGMSSLRKAVGYRSLTGRASIRGEIFQKKQKATTEPLEGESALTVAKDTKKKEKEQQSSDLRDYFQVPIALAEYTTNRDSSKDWEKFGDQLVKGIYYALVPMNVSLVPIRYLMRHRYYQKYPRGGMLPDFDRAEMKAASKVAKDLESGNTPNSEDLAYQCGYYDNQHPAVRCWGVALDLMLATVMSKMPDSPFL